MSPGGHAMRVRVRGIYARRLGGVNTCLTPSRFSRISFRTRSFPYRTAIIVPIEGHIGAVRSTVQDMLSRRASFSFGLVIISGRSASKAANVARGFSGSGGIVRVVPRHSSLNVKKY